MVLILNDLCFMDSFQFMSSSSEKLVCNLPNDKFKYTSEVFQGHELEIIKQKGVYPCDYVDSFYSQLNDESISEGSYKHAQNVCNKFKCLI